MPPRIPKACRKIGCGKATIDSSGFCMKHKPTEASWTKYHNGKDRHERGYGTAWNKLRVTILKRDRYLCQCDECKKLNLIRAATEVDHIIAKAHGGDDSPSNLRAINKECHKAKTARERIMGGGVVKSLQNQALSTVGIPLFTPPQVTKPFLGIG